MVANSPWLGPMQRAPSPISAFGRAPHGGRAASRRRIVARMAFTSSVLGSNVVPSFPSLLRAHETLPDQNRLELATLSTKYATLSVQRRTSSQARTVRMVWQSMARVRSLEWGASSGQAAASASSWLREVRPGGFALTELTVGSRGVRHRGSGLSVGGFLLVISFFSISWI